MDAAEHAACARVVRRRHGRERGVQPLVRGPGAGQVQSGRGGGGAGLRAQLLDAAGALRGHIGGQLL